MFTFVPQLRIILKIKQINFLLQDCYLNFPLNQDFHHIIIHNSIKLNL